MASQAEDLMIQSEITKLGNFRIDQIQSANNNANNKLLEAKDAEEHYVNQLDNANKSREFYIERCKELLNKFQIIELNFEKFLKNIMNKYISITKLYHQSNLNSMEYVLIPVKYLFKFLSMLMR